MKAIFISLFSSLLIILIDETIIYEIEGPIGSIQYNLQEVSPAPSPKYCVTKLKDGGKNINKSKIKDVKRI